MLLSSASSKTAYGTAFQLAQREGIEVVGLTSAANLEFCGSLGCYRRVLSYAQLDRIAADAACVYVDFAGNAGLRGSIHARFVNLKYSSAIGGTHVAQLGGAKDLPGPRATLFFAPAQIPGAGGGHSRLCRRARRTRRPARRAHTHFASGSDVKKAGSMPGLVEMVEVSGIEPLASTLRTSRSPN